MIKLEETESCRALSDFRGVGGGFQPPIRLTDMAGGIEGREFSFLTAWCMKLFLSLVVWQRGLLYPIPEGRRLNRLCAGWLVTPAIEVAFQVRRVVYMSCKEGSGSGAPMILPAVFTMRCSAFLL